MMDKTLNVLDRILTFFEEWTLFITVMIALFSLFFNVILRYGFNFTLAWAEEMVRNVIIYTTFIGCAASVKSRTMIKIDATVQLFPRLKTPLNFFSNFVNLIFSTVILYYGWVMAAMQYRTNQKTIIMQIPYVVLYAILPLMGLMMFIRTVQVIYQDLHTLKEGRSLR